MTLADNSPAAPAAAATMEEDVILLTRVVEEPPTEVVLELGHEEPDPALRLAASPPPCPGSCPAGEPDDPLADLLASLKELPPDFLPSGADPTSTGMGPAAGLPVSEAELADSIRQLAVATVERLARELVPQVAERLVAQEIKAWKKRLCEEE